MISYHLNFPITDRDFEDGILTFSINQIKSRQPSTIYFYLHCYNNELDENNNPVEVGTYTSSRWIIGTRYNHHHETFDTADIEYETGYSFDDVVKYNLEVITFGITSENPLYFTEVMFQEGEFSEYHSPSEIKKSSKIDLIENTYANLYGNNEKYLQVIRPNGESFHTDTLDGAKVTILSPHFDEEDAVDNPVNIYYEALNQREQTIDVLR